MFGAWVMVEGHKETFEILTLKTSICAKNVLLFDKRLCLQIWNVEDVDDDVLLYYYELVSLNTLSMLVST